MNFRFEDCEIDLKRRELRRRGEALHVEPQVFDVLVYLIEHRERMVGKEEILAALWPGRIVTDSALSSRIKSVRQAIGDCGREQRLLKTLHGRGFRFVGEVQSAEQPGGSSTLVGGAASAISPLQAGNAPSGTEDMDWSPRAAGLHGRDEDLNHLRTRLARAFQGGPRVLFLRGPPGSGKSALLRAVLDDAQARGIAVALGHCVELHGECEPFLPLLAALTRRAQAAGGEALVEVLLSHAPTWAMQLPALMDAERLQQASLRALGATRERMLRELGDALEAWSLREPLLLAIEDLHWADPSTLELIDWLARHPGKLRLGLLASLRPSDGRVEGRAQVLSDELALGGLATRQLLECLTEGAVRDLLAERFGPALAEQLAPLAHARSSGHPLWLTTLIEDWVSHGLLRETAGDWRMTVPDEKFAEDLPPSLRQLIERQFQRLDPDDRALLEAASVRGPGFCPVTLADMLDRPLQEVEARCETLAEHGTLIRDSRLVHWPDGIVAGSYDFVHQLYQEALYQRLPPARRARLHQRLGDRLEARHGERAAEIAALLGMHFLRGHYADRAVRYLVLAAQSAFSRSAVTESLEYLRLAESVLPDLPPGAARLHAQREVRTWIGSLRMLAHGFADEGAEQAFRDANRISEQLGEDPAGHPAFFTLAAMHEFRGEFPASFAMMQERVRGGFDREDRATPAQRYLVETHELMACSMFYQGVFERSLENAAVALEHYDPERMYAVDAAFGANPAINCRGWQAFALCLTGRPDSALDHAREGLRIAQRNDHRHSLAAARHRLAVTLGLRGEIDACQEQARQALDEALRAGVPYNIALTQAVLGWALGCSGDPAEGMRLIEDALQGSARIGAHLDRPFHLGLLAEVLVPVDPAAALGHLDRALQACKGERRYFWKPELLRLRALALHGQGQARASAIALDEAQACAEQSAAIWLALRIAHSRCILFPHDRVGRQRLQSLDAALTEGAATALRRTTRALLTRADR